MHDAPSARHQLTPADLQYRPRPADREIYRKPPSLAHLERAVRMDEASPEGGASL